MPQAKSTANTSDDMETDMEIQMLSWCPLPGWEQLRLYTQFAFLQKDCFTGQWSSPSSGPLETNLSAVGPIFS